MASYLIYMKRIELTVRRDMTQVRWTAEGRTGELSNIGAPYN